MRNEPGAGGARTGEPVAGARPSGSKRHRNLRGTRLPRMMLSFGNRVAAQCGRLRPPVHTATRKAYGEHRTVCAISSTVTASDRSREGSRVNAGQIDPRDRRS
jgi:hypothetical protein